MANTTAIVTASTLNVRERAGTDATIVRQLTRGAVVQVLAPAGSWYEIQSGSTHGFVHGDFLHFDTTPTASGFLCENQQLCTCALAAPADRQIAERGLDGDALQGALTWNRLGGMLDPLSERLDIARSGAVAVLCVESGGKGFVNGRMVIRFENHVFWDRWGVGNPATFKQHFTFDSAKRWTGHRYRVSLSDDWHTVHGVGQDAEWAAFAIARDLDETSAIRSISMGASQIMGFNHAAIGYDSARAMFDRFSTDERFHVLGLFDFVKGPGTTSATLEALRRSDYERFATGYNGAGNAMAYAGKIRSAATAFDNVVRA
jgi:hypothetical protein